MSYTCLPYGYVIFHFWDVCLMSLRVALLIRSHRSAFVQVYSGDRCITHMWMPAGLGYLLLVAAALLADVLIKSPLPLRRVR